MWCSCGPMMLDVLFKIKDEMDPTLAFRRSCRYALPPSLTLGVPILGFCRKDVLNSLEPYPQQLCLGAGRASVGRVP